MKNMLSFFFCLLIFFHISTVTAEDSMPEANFSLKSGISYKGEYLQARVYGDFEKDSTDDVQSELSAWGIKLEAFDFLSIMGGNLVYSGLWSRFNSPAPYSIDSLKQAYSLSSGLNTYLPGKTTSTANLAIATVLDFPFMEFTAFCSGFEENNITAGAGTSFPFSVNPDKTIFPLGLRGLWTIAWKMSYVEQKNHTTWFMPQPMFPPDYIHAFLQEFSLKTQANTLTFSAGITQMPYGQPAKFLRTEYSLSLPIFLLNAQFFLCDIDYLGLNESFERDTVHIALNPQLRFDFIGKFIRSLKFGISTKTIHENTTDTFPQNDWITSATVGTEIRFVMFLLSAKASVSELLLKNLAISPTAPMQKDSLLKIQTDFAFYPWYLDAFSRTWTFGADYECYVQKPDSVPNLYIDGKFSGTILIAQKHKIGLNASVALQYKVNQTLSLYTTLYTFKASTEIKTSFLNSSQQLQLSAQTELYIKEKSFYKAETDFSVILLL